MPLPSSSCFAVLLLSWLALSCILTEAARQLILVNNCNHTVWPATLGGAGHATPQDGGFRLEAGGESIVDVPELWSGRIWAREGCAFDKHGKGACNSGGCGGALRCHGTSGEPPTTVVEMTLGTRSSPLHFYDVSLVDGFNLPVSVRPVGGSGGCGVAACEVDLNGMCPVALEVRKEGRVVGCKSACLAMGSAKYCCTGMFGSPRNCRPTLFANLFKAMCPKAYSYAFDDAKSLNKCRAPRYVITFCPPQ